jgi:hypothetical protein
MNIFKKLFGKKEENTQPTEEQLKPSNLKAAEDVTDEQHETQDVIDSNEFAVRFLAAGKQQDLITLMQLPSMQIRCGKCKQVSTGTDARIHPVVFKCPRCNTVWFNGIS